MTGRFAVGEHVLWRWAGRAAEGVVDEIFTSRVERLIKGSRIVRNGTPERPAYLLRQADGGEVLKLESELTRG